MVYFCRDVLVESKWDNDAQTIIRTTFSGVVTTADLYEGNDSIVNYANSVEHSVDVVIDTLDTTDWNVNLLAAARDLNRRIPDNVGLFILVRSKQTRFLEVMERVMRPLMMRFMKNSRTTYSLDEAYTIIKEYRAEPTVENRNVN